MSVLVSETKTINIWLSTRGLFHQFYAVHNMITGEMGHLSLNGIVSIFTLYFLKIVKKIMNEAWCFQFLWEKKMYGPIPIYCGQVIKCRAGENTYHPQLHSISTFHYTYHNVYDGSHLLSIIYVFRYCIFP